jgi:hypothetical protein
MHPGDRRIGSEAAGVGPNVLHEGWECSAAEFASRSMRLLGKQTWPIYVLALAVPWMLPRQDK